MEEEKLSLRGNPQLLGLFLKIQEYEPSANRVEIFTRAIALALSESVDWKQYMKHEVNYPQPGSTPEFIQLRVSKSSWNQIVDEIIGSFTPPLQRITKPYVVKLVLLHYINYLQHFQNYNIERAYNNQNAAKLIKTLCEMIIANNNAEGLERIEEILTNWERGNA